MNYSVTLEHGTDGSYLAWVHELPGCFARAETREAVESQLPDAIRAFREWLGEPAEDVDVAVVSEVDSAIDSSEDTEVLLDPDRDALTAEHWQTVERWLQHSRRDLLDRLADVDASHIGFVELMYAAWTFDLDNADGQREFLEWTRQIAVTRMSELARRRDASLTYANWAGAPRPEPWTARKAARRLVWHERLHT